MSLAVAIQMDPVHQININADSTFALGLEAQRRGHTLFYYEPRDLSMRDGRAYARMRPLTLRREAGNHSTLGSLEKTFLENVDVVLMRQDPPFDMSYITATHILETVHPKTLVVNDPAGVRSSPEKIFPLMFPDIMPPTLVTRDRAVIDAFRAKHHDIIVKPLYGHGGAGVFRLTEADSNLDSLLELFLGRSGEPVMVQAFLPAVADGDKRIILIDGEPVGAINRKPKAGQVRSNLRCRRHGGGDRAERRAIREICARHRARTSKRRGLIFDRDRCDRWTV